MLAARPQTQPHAPRNRSAVATPTSLRNLAAGSHDTQVDALGYASPLCAGGKPGPQAFLCIEVSYAPAMRHISCEALFGSLTSASTASKPASSSEPKTGGERRTEGGKEGRGKGARAGQREERGRRKREQGGGRVRREEGKRGRRREEGGGRGKEEEEEEERNNCMQSFGLCAKANEPMIAVVF